MMKKRWKPGLLLLLFTSNTGYDLSLSYFLLHSENEIIGLQHVEIANEALSAIE